MSVSGSIAMALLRACKPFKSADANMEKMRAKAERHNSGFRFSMPRSSDKVRFGLLEDAERPCLIITPENVRAGRAVLYIYGGIYNSFNAQLRMAISYARDCETEVWYPVYPSQTEVNIGDTVGYLANIYRRMTERFRHDRIALVGVSMGGLYALDIVSHINRLDPNIPMPGLIIAHSPGGTPADDDGWEEMRAYSKRDPIFSESDFRASLKLIPGGAKPDWLVSPALGSFENAPPTYIYYGEEMPAGNAPALCRAYEKCGVLDRLHIEIRKNMMHGYSSIPVFPESRRAYKETVEEVKRL